ncbi:MAG: RNA 2',3'-cyclic phosphodiesterase [Acidobacteriota bacterium]
MPRAFLAFGFPPAIREELVALQPTARPGVHPAARDQLHLTLLFLGELSESRLSSLAGALDELVHPAPRLALAGVGVFANDDRPSFLWVGVERSEELLELRSRLLSVVETLGIEVASETYRPHVTLARVDRLDEGVFDLFERDHANFRVELVAERLGLWVVAGDGQVPRYLERHQVRLG